MFTTVNGGFELIAADQQLVLRQRAITKHVNEKFIQVGAVLLKAAGKMPVDEKWAESAYLDTNLQSWIDDEAHRLTNVGFNLQLGFTDVDIDAEDPAYNECVLAALDYLGVDTRFRFGRRSVGYPTHVLVQLTEEESAGFAELSRFEPKEFRIAGKRYHVQLRSYPTGIDKKNLSKSAKQTVMPGSIYTAKVEGSPYDLSVWYHNGSAIAENVHQLATTTLRKTNYHTLLRALAFAAFLYVIRDHWVEGQRQLTATKVSGWLARVVAEGQAMNNHEAISADVFCPIDTDELAEALLSFVCGFCGDDEAHMRVRAYNDAREKLDRNPDAKIPGWPAMDALVGPQGVNALRTTFTPGSDVSILTKMAERYAFDDTDGFYIDRERHANNFDTFVHEPGSLERRHIDETVIISGKPRPAFRMFETSKMRARVAHRNMYPDQEPGAIFRLNKKGQIISDDDPDPTGSPVFNTWRGWPIGPAEVVDPKLMAECVANLDKLLGLITCDNERQVHWIKQWLAWIIQHPSDKQQIAPVIVGGQGVGKSFFGNTFTGSLFGSLWGSASASIVSDKFNIGPFVNKMVVFIDEVKFHNEAGTDEVKKLIRNVDVPGMLKYGEGGNFKIYSRMIFASNTFDMSIGQKSVLDRALFYVRAADAKYMQLPDAKFREWADTLKPWFTEYDTFLKRIEVKEHYMRYFMDMAVTKGEVESIRYSSGTDAEIMAANIRPSRRIAKFILEEGRIHDDLSLEFPFNLAHLSVRIQDICNTLNVRPIRTDLIVAEFAEAGILGQGRGLLFKYRHETLIDKYAEATSMTIEKWYDFTEDDRGDNDKPDDKKPWKGGTKSRF